MMPSGNGLQTVALKELAGGFIQIADRVDRVVDPHA
jgi:hypothetical protein